MKIKISLLSIAGLCMMLSTSHAEVDFAKEIWPILEKSCVKCHGPDYKDKRGRTKKAKGGLRLDSKTAIMKGGERQEDDGEKTVDPGKPNKSLLYTLSILSEDDDDVMPPKGDLLTKKEADLLKKWIQEGAKFGSWTKGKFVRK